MARIPSRQRRQRYRLVGQKHPADFVAVLVNRRDQARVGLPHLRWHCGGDALFRSEVETSETPQGLREVDTGYRLEGVGDTLRRHRRAIIESGMLAGWGGFARRDPAIQVHECSAEERPVIGPVERLLTA